MIGRTISHYRISEKLGEGGMGVVYKAQDTTLERTVALKFLPSHISVNEETKARFLQEAKAAAALNHPNICTIFGVEQADGQMFIVMEYIEGGTLRERLPFAKSDEAINVAAQIGEALQEAHSKGIVHRDIKADNIMLTSKGQAKVMDFGLAKLKGSLKLTRTSSTVGTLGYMAPEQIQGGEVDHRSDIFSFGVLVFEMLTGKLPFRGEHEAAMVYSIVNEDPELLQKHRLDASEDLQRIISRALEKDPEDRYQSAADIVSELRRLQKKTSRISRTIPVAAVTQAETAGPSVEKPLRAKISRRTLYVGVVVCILLVGLGLSYVLFRGPSGMDRKSIAVLPFKNMNIDEDSEFFSDGITEDIINQLSKIRDLRVMSRPAVMRYKKSDKTLQEIGKELRVGTILTGTVRRVGDQLRISAALVDASNEQQIWGDVYEKTMTQVFEIQNTVARQIASTLKTNLSPEEAKGVSKQQTGNIEAYTYYLKGREYYYRYHKEDNENAIKLFKKALELDQNYALAYAGLGDAYGQRVQRFGFPSAWVDSSIQAGERSIAIDPTLAEGYKALALGYQQLGKVNLALENYKKSVELNPSYYPAVANIGAAYESVGRPDEALPWAKKSVSINPTNPVTLALLGGIYFDLEKDLKAQNYFHRALELQPDLLNAQQGLATLDFLGGRKEEAEDRALKLAQTITQEPGPPLFAGIVYFFRRDFTKALPYFEKELAMTEPESGSYNQLAYIYAKLGRTSESKKMLEQNIGETLKFWARGDEGPDSRVSLAISYKLQGNNPQAYKWLREALQAGWSDYRMTPLNPLFDSFRNDPEFKQIMDDVNNRMSDYKKRAEELDKD